MSTRPESRRSATLFVIYLGPKEDERARSILGYTRFRLQRGLYLMESERTRSRVYPAIEREVSSDAASLVAPLADAPKSRKMFEGVLKWVRSRRHQ